MLARKSAEAVPSVLGTTGNGAVSGSTPRSFASPLRNREMRTRRKIILIAPNSADCETVGDAGDEGTGRYERLLSAVQQFRGRIYSADGAIRSSDLDEHGRHRLPADYQSWHLVSLDDRDQVCGCSRYRVHPRHRPFSDLSASRSALAQSPFWEPRVHDAIESLRNLAWRRGVDFVEVGGWAITEELRRTPEALRIALGTYALAGLLGGCIAITTATIRHHSAYILRKIGGSSIMSGQEELPPYYDLEYDCEMQLLKFDYAHPNPSMAVWIEQLRQELASVEVIQRRSPSPADFPQMPAMLPLMTCADLRNTA